MAISIIQKIYDKKKLLPIICLYKLFRNIIHLYTYTLKINYLKTSFQSQQKPKLLLKKYFKIHLVFTQVTIEYLKEKKNKYSTSQLSKLLLKALADNSEVNVANYAASFKMAATHLCGFFSSVLFVLTLINNFTN